MATYFGWCCDCAVFGSDSCLKCQSKNSGFGLPTMYISKGSFLAHPVARSSLAAISVSLDAGTYKPTRAHEDDAGLDLYSPVNKLILPKCYAVIDTGVHIAIPKGYVGLITSKSGLMAKKGITS